MTEKHKQEGQEKIWVWMSEPFQWHATKGAKSDVEYVRADILSSRDKEIRDVLEGLVIRRYNNVPCWCDKGRAIPMGLNHEPACLATRVLWEKVQPGREITESRTVEPHPYEQAHKATI